MKSTSFSIHGPSDEPRRRAARVPFDVGGYSKRSSRSRRRFGGWWGIMTAVVVCLTLVTLIPLAGRWAQYRNSHIVSHNAFVNGMVTNVGAAISGRVAAIMVDQAERVSAGQVILRLEDDELQAEADHARLAMKLASQELSTVVLPPECRS